MLKEDTCPVHSAALAFGRNGDIVVKTLAGRAEVQITTNPFSDGNPTWSPDGTRIAYSANSEADDGEGSADHTSEICTIHPDGTGISRITDDDFSTCNRGGRLTDPRWFAARTPRSHRRCLVSSTGGVPT